jgi:hypothetical protein
MIDFATFVAAELKGLQVVSCEASGQRMCDADVKKFLELELLCPTLSSHSPGWAVH